MANAELAALKAQFRRDVDDVDLDPTDQSGLLWSDDDVLHYLNVAHSEFVRETRYRPAILEVPVVTGLASSNLPSRVVELRSDKGYLATAQVEVVQVNHEERFLPREDYGVSVNSDPFSSSDTGVPRSFSLDMDDSKVAFFPTPSADDSLRIAVWLEANEINDWDCTPDVRNPRHQRMLLAGMKREAYRKHDADTMNMEKALFWEARFAADVEDVRAERERRNTHPAPIPYGGL